MDLGSSAGCGPPFGMRRIPLDHGTWHSSGGQNLRSAKLQATSLTSFRLQDIMGEERRGNMKKKIDNNNLLPYFTDHHADLPADYLESCEEFFIKLIKENKVKHDSIKKTRL